MDNLFDEIRSQRIKPVELLIKGEMSQQLFVVNPIFFEIELAALARKMLDTGKKFPTVQCLTLASGKKALITYWGNLESRIEGEKYFDTHIIKEILYCIIPNDAIDNFLVGEVEEVPGRPDEKKVKYIFKSEGNGCDAIDVVSTPDIPSELIKSMLEKHLASLEDPIA